MQSSSKRLSNDILNIVKSSDKKIPPSSYYVIRIKFLEKQDDKEFCTIAKFYLSSSIISYNSSELPLITYVSEDEIFFLYSSIDETSEHNLGGSHQNLCSDISSVLTKKCNCLVKCSIVEFESRAQILAYFHIEVYNTMTNFMNDMLGEQLSTSSLTFQEAKDVFDKHCSKKWKDQESHKKFGSFYKYTNSSGGKFLVLSEVIDMRNVEKYEEYIFS